MEHTSDHDILCAMLANAGLTRADGSQRHEARVYREYERGKRILRQFLAIPRELSYKEGIDVVAEWTGV